MDLPVTLGRAVLGFGMMALISGCSSDARAPQRASDTYPNMAPLAQYLAHDAAEEVALARSAAPASISNDADVLVLGPKGYEPAAKGKSGFVCLVERSWANNFDNDEFWNPKTRAPHCFNPAAARSVLPTYVQRTDWLLSGVSKANMLERTKAALAAGQIAAPEVGSMAYMMSKHAYLGDSNGGPWHPHLMFYLPRATPTAWGANVQGSPVFADSGALEPVTVFFVPVTVWSDGTPAPESAPAQ